jgi:hypothetical protein
MNSCTVFNGSNGNLVLRMENINLSEYRATIASNNAILLTRLPLNNIIPSINYSINNVIPNRPILENNIIANQLNNNVISNPLYTGNNNIIPLNVTYRGINLSNM